MIVRIDFVNDSAAPLFPSFHFESMEAHDPPPLETNAQGSIADKQAKSNTRFMNSSSTSQHGRISLPPQNEHEADRSMSMTLQDVSIVSQLEPSFLQPELPFSTLGLVGRTQEKQTLQEVVDAVVPIQDSPSTQIKTPPPESAYSHAPQHTLALISGPSGSGKSVLAMDFQRQCFNRHAFFVSGKFDLKQMEEPYSGIKTALTDLCRQMLALQGSEDPFSSSTHSRSTFSDHDNQTEDPRRFSDLQNLFTKGLSTSEIQTLSKIIPDILKVADLASSETKPKVQRSPSISSGASGSAAESYDCDSKAEHRVGYREQSDRLKFTLRRFMQISCQFCPVIMVIDDLQWSDKPSIDLLKSWMLMDTGGSRANHHSLLIMGCFRSEASERSSILQDSIEEVKRVQEARSINICEVNLGDMKVSQVHEFVCGLLLPPKTLAPKSTDSISTANQSQVIIGGHETLALAQLVHKRTGGNIFFVKQYLQQLCRDNLIYYDHTEHRWAWKSEAEVLEKSAITTNIVDLMKHKLTQIVAARQILPIAACLGATFSKSKLTMVIKSLSIHSDHSAFFRKVFNTPRILEDSWINDILQSCEREGLIESHREPTRNKSKKGRRPARNDHNDVYTFVHDKVQEASFSLIPTDSVTELQYRVGEALSACLTPNELIENIFMVASLINLKHDLIPNANRSDRRMKIAMLNNSAGEKAVSCGAFQSALSYFMTAISLLPEDHWKSHFEDSLNLYSSVAECSFVTADTEQMRAYASEVVNQDCPILHKIRAYHILIDSAAGEVENNQGLDPVSMCLFVLAELGYKFPRNKMVQGITTLRGMLNMKRCVPKWTLQQFDDLPICTDPKELAITKTLSRLSTVAYLLKPDIVPLVILKLVQRNFDHGISQHSVLSFSMLGLIVGFFMGDFHSSRKLAQISLRLTDQVDCQETKASTIFLAHVMCLHWTSPIEDSEQSYQECYRIGMANGEIDAAAWGLYYSINVRLFSGTPLPVIEDDLSRYTQLAKDFHQTHPYLGCALLWQMIRNLQGKTENRTLLVGHVYNEVAELERLEHAPDPQRPLGIKTAKLYAATYLGDYAIGAKIGAESYDERLKRHAGLIILPPAIFQSGLCCYATCSSKTVSLKLRKKYQKTAKKCRAKLRDWQAKGNPNCDQFVAILDAEHLVLKGKYKSATKHYAIAIALAKRRGCIQDEALAHERLADHLLKGDSSLYGSNAQQCVGRAIELAEQWGAIVKVAELREKHAQFVATSPNSSSL